MSAGKLKDLQDDKGISAYCKVAADLIVYALGITTGSIEAKTSFTPEMVDAGEQLIASLQTLSIDAQQNALQEFLFSLFSQKRCGEADKYTFLTYHFLVLYSFTENGNLRACNSFSQYFSKVIFFARAAILNRIMSVAKQKAKGSYE